jgi:hypothetical protein
MKDPCSSSSTLPCSLSEGDPPRVLFSGCKVKAGLTLVLVGVFQEGTTLTP